MMICQCDGYDVHNFDSWAAKQDLTRYIGQRWSVTVPKQKEGRIWQLYFNSLTTVLMKLDELFEPFRCLQNPSDFLHALWSANAWHIPHSSPPQLCPWLPVPGKCSESGHCPQTAPSLFIHRNTAFGERINQHIACLYMAFLRVTVFPVTKRMRGSDPSLSCGSYQNQRVCRQVCIFLWCNKR